MAKKTKQEQKEQKETTESLFKPLVRAGDEKHLFEEMEAEGEELPILTSVGYAPISANSRHYVAYTIKSRGSEILSVEVTEPDLRQIAEDSAKIAFYENFMLRDDFKGDK